MIIIFITVTTYNINLDLMAIMILGINFYIE